MEPRTFDDISRALASGSSRRGVLKGMLGGLIAGALGRSQALAQDDCPGGKVTICHRTRSRKNPFNVIEVCSDSLPDHEAHGDLVSCPGEGFVDFGTCTCACELECEGNFVLDEENCACVCGLVDEDCPNLEVADEEACACFCPIEDIVCEDGHTLNPETCACDANPNPECAGATCTTFVPCSSGNPDCVCGKLANGGGICVPGSTPCSSLQSCGPDFSCPEGSICSIESCCGTVCVPVELECTEGADARRSPASVTGEATFGGN